MSFIGANVAQDLNNAIYSLASLNPSNVLAGNLNNSWQAWYAGARNYAPDAAWWAVFKGFWMGYAAARISATNLNERTPPASDIDPTLWKTLSSELESRGELLTDAGRAAGEAISNAARPVLVLAAVVAIGLLFSRYGGRR